MTISIERTALEVALHNALIATSKDRSRPILEGAVFETTVVERTGEQRWLEFSVTATDSYRLVSTSIKLGHDVKALPRRIIVGDIKGMLAAVKKMSGNSISITLNEDRDEIELREDYSTTWQDRPTFWSPAIEGDYPKWQQLVPTLDTTNPPCPPPAFNPAFLSDVGKLRHPAMDGTSVKNLRDSKMVLINRYVDKLTPTIWHFTRDHHAKLEAFMLLMPVKYEMAE
jgi:hypothetical protein